MTPSELDVVKAALFAALDTLMAATAGPEEEFEGVKLKFYFANRGLVERERPGFGNRLMISEYRKRDQPHEYVPWGQGVLPEQSGTNEDWLSKYNQYKPMYQNAYEDGVMPHVVTLISDGEEAFLFALRAMYNSAWGEAWLANPLTVGMRPKTAP